MGRAVRIKRYITWHPPEDRGVYSHTLCPGLVDLDCLREIFQHKRREFEMRRRARGQLP